MSNMLGNCQHLVWIAVRALMLAAIITFGWGAVKPMGFIVALLSGGKDTLVIVIYIHTPCPDRTNSDNNGGTCLHHLAP